MSSIPPPSPEVKAILKLFCEKQREKYGDNWKEVLAKEMANQTTPIINALISMRKPNG